MKNSFNEKVAIVFGFIAIAVSFFVVTGKSNRALAYGAGPDNLPVELTAAAPDAVKARPASQLVVAPYIVQDTDNDSPGTNIVTRIVTFTAGIGGTPLPALQWKVDKGAGFVKVAGATKPTLRIGNAQVSDSGLYALFGTNSAGEVHTTPQQIVITEGED